MAEQAFMGEATRRREGGWPGVWAGGRAGSEPTHHALPRKVAVPSKSTVGSPQALVRFGFLIRFFYCAEKLLFPTLCTPA